MPATITQGFLLTRQRIETDQGIELRFWASTPGGPLRWRVTGQEAVAFFPEAAMQSAQGLLARISGTRFGTTRLLDFRHQPVVALYCKTHRALLDCRDALQSRGIPVYEADVNAADRYLMERFITGGLVLRPQDDSGYSTDELLNPRVRAADYRPALKCVSFDIETSIRGDELYSIALYHAGGGLVLMRGESQDLGQQVRMAGSEAELLGLFMEWVREFDPDVLIGWNVVNFDLRMLQQCCDRLHIGFLLGRGGEAVHWRQSRDSSQRFFATIPGRVALDGIELMRTATYQFENFSLDHVASELLGRGKLIDDADQRGMEITRLFHQDKRALCDYNLEDCRLVWDIFQQQRLLDFAVERSQLTGLELNRYGGSVAAFDHLYLPRLHREGFVAPAPRPGQAQNVSPGGYVLDSLPGIYDHVIVLDFKSLYPSIIRTFHVDPLALVVGEQESDPIPGFDGGRFSRARYILPLVIAELWSARDRAKASGNKVLSQAIKIIMNSFYGVLGTSGCRFLDSRLVSSITRRGHQIIIDSKEFIEQQGYSVIYGDTDSLFVHVGAPAGESVGHTGKQLAARLNKWWRDRLLQEYRLESYLEIEFETHFIRFLMPTVRGAETGSKKRYAGLVAGDSGPTSHRLIFKGLETVRSDWSLLARQFQKDLYEKIFLDLPWEAYIKSTVTGLLTGQFSNELVLRRRLRRRLRDYVHNVPPHVQAARKAEARRRELDLPPLYENGGWIEYLMTVNGPEPRQYRQSAIDYQFYVDRQIRPIADAILVFRSTSMEELLNRQIQLFQADDS